VEIDVLYSVSNSSVKTVLRIYIASRLISRTFNMNAHILQIAGILLACKS